MKGSSSQVPDKPLDPPRLMTRMIQVRSCSSFSSFQADLFSATHVSEMHTQIPTALTLAPVGTLVCPYDTLPQVLALLQAAVFVPVTFST